jgi:hypothetical protein
MKITEKSIPQNKVTLKGGLMIPNAFKYQRALRWDYEFRENLLNKMQSLDPNINGNCFRCLAAEVINFIDGERTVEEISEAVGYEYGVLINPEHIIEFLKKTKELGQITFKK